MPYKNLENIRDKFSRMIIRRTWKKAAAISAFFVVFCVLHVLVLPAVTMSRQQTYCGLEEHEHTEECLDMEGNQICGISDHMHVLACYSDMAADLEDEELWKQELPDLTGDRRADAVNIAESLIGYCESVHNFIVSEDRAKGYTRFGHWYGEMLDSILSEEAEETEEEEKYGEEYGEKYEEGYEEEYEEGYEEKDIKKNVKAVFAGEIEDGGVVRMENGLPSYSYMDWNAMFISYVLHYAQISEFGFEKDAGDWIGVLEEIGLFADVENHIPSVGDLIFFTSYEGAEVQVGIVSRINTGIFGIGDRISSISVILGDHDNSVSEINIATDEKNAEAVIREKIIGYGVLMAEEQDTGIRNVRK